MESAKREPEKSPPQDGAGCLAHMPFVIGVMADLRGTGSEACVPLEKRVFVDINVANFDRRMATESPRVVFQVPDVLSGAGNLHVDITFKSLDDFSPENIALAVEPLSSLLKQRSRIANLLAHVDGMSGPEEVMSRLLRDPEGLRALTDQPVDAARFDDPQGQATNYIAQLRPALKGFDRNQSTVRRATYDAMRSLAQHVLTNPELNDGNAVSTLNSVIDRIDHRLSRQINLILHHPDFQALEGTWRGLAFLVNQVRPDEIVKIRILNISKRELRREAWKHSREGSAGSSLAKVVDAGSQVHGGLPFGLLLTDFEFCHSPEDVAILGLMAEIAHAAHAPFLAGAAPTLLGLKSWPGLQELKDIVGFFRAPEYIAWRSFRESENARYVGLAMPRVLARPPYGRATNPVESFEFEEEMDNEVVFSCCWMSAAFCMATVCARSIRQNGWGGMLWDIEGRLVEHLPTRGLSDGQRSVCGPAEVAIDDRRLAEIARSGLSPLLSFHGSGELYLGTDQSCHKAPDYEDPEANTYARGTERLFRTLFVCRFAHLLLHTARHDPSCPRDSRLMEQWLNTWLEQFVAAGDSVQREEWAARPLAAARVDNVDDVQAPGQRRLRLHLKVRTPDLHWVYAVRTDLHFEVPRTR